MMGVLRFIDLLPGARRGRAAAVVVCVMIAGCLGVTQSASAAFHWTMQGSWSCDNKVSETTSPIVGARVEFYRSNVGNTKVFDSRIGTTHTDGNGFYSVSFVGNDENNYYARLILNDDASVALHEWYTGNSWEYDTPFGNNATPEATNFGNLTLANSSVESPKCAVWQGARAAYQDYERTVGHRPPTGVSCSPSGCSAGSYDISLEPSSTYKTPFSTLATTHWPDGFRTRGNSDFSVNFHEFAHTVRQSFDGDFNNFLNDAIVYGYARSHHACAKTNDGFAFNEGWAEFWAHDWEDEPSCKTNTPDKQVEGNVAELLDQLSACQGVGRAGMISVLAQSSSGIHSYDQFETRFRQIFPGVSCPGRPAPALTVGNAGEQLTGLHETTTAYLAALNREVEAKTHALGLPPCTVIPCNTLAERLIAAPILRGQLEQTALLISFVKNAIAQQAQTPDGFTTQMFSPAFESAEKAAARAFDGRNETIVIDTLKQALGALTVAGRNPDIARRNPDIARKIGELRPTLSELLRLQSTGAPVPDSIALPEPPGGDTALACPVITGCRATFQRLGQGAVIIANLALATRVGILVNRILSTRRIHGRPILQLRKVGRVPLGLHHKGRLRIRWNLRVDGRKLPPGRYLITLRALDSQKHVTALAKPAIFTIH
jgi:hypothetical protein